MLKKKKQRRKENQRGSLVTILIFFMVLVLLWLSWSFMQQFFPWDEQDLTENLQPVPLRITSADEFRDQSRQLDPDRLPNPELLDELFPASFTLLIDGRDINNDGSPNFLLVTESAEPASQELTGLGYDRIITEAQLLSQQTDGSLELLLSITETAITDINGDPLIAQVPAPHGYGFSYSAYAQAPYRDEVILFEIVILDENKQAASDDLTIYWHPARQLYAATNAFGAPGTF
ncbi:hypothetical protein CYPRO_0947 [Cyclonatronum proteinivorum]|uniref:Uncharacterized protein n=1 Tax=Cyclonatronum proteinivorum TaxID=1457365 RepID=A0A345UIC2_9BACT|nr:hypothetical protein [Cyclonatronum proteinivorum]AXJ00224.1 hypothetical protein CYPRO_0947 [Cyclonatronum proteinivorum]